MALRVRRKVIRRPRDEEEDDVEEKKVSKQEVEEETGDELDEVPKQIKKLAENPDDDIPEVFRRPTKKVVVPPPAAKKIIVPSRPVVEEDELPIEKPVKDYQTKTVNDVVTDNLFGALLEVLQTGGEIIITKLAENKWNLKMNGAGKQATAAEMEKYVTSFKAEMPKTEKVSKDSGSVGTKLVGKEYEQEVCTQEYLDFVEEWRGMDITEKRKYAKSLKCVWEHADDLKIENMHMSAAVQAKKGITKYKPKYQSGKARAAVKG